MKQLYNIYYIDTTYGDASKYEGTTDNFEVWLKQHNEKRIADGNEEEKAHDFKVEEIYQILFNEEIK